MIAEVIPEAYDYFGKKVTKPTGKRIRVFHPTFPMGRYLSKPLAKKFDDIDGLRKFLFECKYVSDPEQFGEIDYWLPPEEFEKSKKGDCEDYALYAWRQLMEMGIKSRFVVGEAGRYDSGHAWLTIQMNGRNYLFEPLMCAFKKLPRLSMIRYIPEISVEYNRGKISYFSHKRMNYNPSFIEAFKLFSEWLIFWTRKWLFTGAMIILMPFILLKKLFFRN